jgi:hypothetical protein
VRSRDRERINDFPAWRNDLDTSARGDDHVCLAWAGRGYVQGAASVAGVADLRLGLVLARGEGVGAQGRGDGHGRRGRWCRCAGYIRAL